MGTPIRATFLRAALGELRELLRDVAGTIEAGGLDDAQRSELVDGILRATETLDDAHRRAARGEG